MVVYGGVVIKYACQYIKGKILKTLNFTKNIVRSYASINGNQEVTQYDVMGSLQDTHKVAGTGIGVV